MSYEKCNTCEIGNIHLDVNGLPFCTFCTKHPQMVKNMVIEEKEDKKELADLRSEVYKLREANRRLTAHLKLKGWVPLTVGELKQIVKRRTDGHNTDTRGDT